MIDSKGRRRPSSDVPKAAAAASGTARGLMGSGEKENSAKNRKLHFKWIMDKEVTPVLKCSSPKRVTF